MDKKISISVVIPAYNSRQYLEKCISSVTRQCVETEIIVVDDCSTDGTYEYISRLENQLDADIAYIRNSTQMGVAATRNLGVRASSGTHIAFLDSDDWWEDDKLTEQLKLMEVHPEFTFTGRRNVPGEGYAGRVFDACEIPSLKGMLKENAITCSSVIVEKGLALKYPMSREDVCEDYLMWLQMIRDGIQPYGINKPLVNYRVTRHSLSGNKLRHAMKRHRTYKEFGIPYAMRQYYSAYYCMAKGMQMLKGERK